MFLNFKEGLWCNWEHGRKTGRGSNPSQLHQQQMTKDEGKRTEVGGNGKVVSDEF